MARHAAHTQDFEADRPRLLGIAYRLLGSVAEAEDALQEAWIRVQTVDWTEIQNVRAWLTTIVSRIAIDMLRARRRREAIRNNEEAGAPPPPPPLDPEGEALLAESIGTAMLVVLDRLRPPERVAFVLHDMFALPFAEIAEVLDCSPEAARQLASRARRAVRARRGEVAEIGRERRRELVQAFFAASRGGDMAKLMSILDANVALKIDPLLAPGGAPLLVRGADVVARRASLGAAQQNAATLMLVDGEPGIVVAPNGKLRLVMTFETVGRKIAAIDIVADPCRLEKLTLAMVDD